MKLFDWLKKDDEEPAPSEPQPASVTAPGADAGALAAEIVQALKQVYDPEIPVNIYDLGLIYSLDVDEAEGVVQVEMTLTAPGCPVAQTFPGIVEQAVAAVPGVSQATVTLVWEPPWTRERMSEAAQLELGML